MFLHVCRLSTVSMSVCLTWLLFWTRKSVSDVPTGTLLFLMVTIPAEGEKKGELLLHL